MTVRTFALFAVTCFAASACGGGGYGSSPSPTTPTTPTTPSNPNTPAVADQVNATPSLTFDPPTLTTKVGHTVTFAFGSVGHNIFFDTATGAPGDIPGVNANTSVTRTFATAGTFTYTCHIHPYMQGSVVVE
jgi:plastocyanin